jgi:hypothetical protein
LLRYIGAGTKERSLELRYFQDQFSPIYSVSSTDLTDERWLIRAWHADRWLRGALKRFQVKDISKARWICGRRPIQARRCLPPVFRRLEMQTCWRSSRMDASITASRGITLS